MTPLRLDALCREQNVTLATLRAALPAEVFALSPARAWLGFARAWLVIAVGEVMLAKIDLGSGLRLLWTVPALVVAWLIVASGMVGLFILGHDCGHGSFARRRWVNTLVGHLCMSPIITGFHNWRLSHNHHHSHAQLRGEDTDWAERMLTREQYDRASGRERVETLAAFGSPIGLLVGFLVGMVRRTAMAALYPQVKLTARARRELWLSNLTTLAVSGGIGAALFAATGLAGLTKHYLVPLYLGMVLGAFFTYLHHSGEGSIVFDAEGWSPLRGQLVSTFDVRFGAWFEALFFHINRHPPHHLAPRIPWYHLPRAMDALRRANPDLHVARRFSLGYLLRGWRAPLVERAAAGMFVAAPRPQR